MTMRVRHSIVLSMTAVALLAAPVLLNGSVPYISDISAIAGNGNGNGNGGGNGNSGGNGNGGGNSGGNGNGHSSSDDSSSNSSTASASSGGSDNAGSGKKKKKAVEEDIEAAELEGTTTKTKNLNPQLGRLNSLKRNINGLMNSSDPKMDGIREFIIANGTLADAQAELETATQQLADAQAAFDALADSLGVGDYPDTTPAGLQAALDLVEDQLVDAPDDPDLLAEQQLLTDALAAINGSAELQNLNDAATAVGDAEADVAEAEEAVSEDALREALLLAANPNRSDDDLTDEIVAWASNELGVGDANGLIDDFLASR